MDETYSQRPQAGTRGRTSWRLWLAVVLVAAILAALAAFYLTRAGSGPSPLSTLFNLRSEQAAPVVAPDPGSPAPAPSAAQTRIEFDNAREAVERVERVAEQQGGLDVRVAAMEQRLTRLDLQSQAAAGNAARAEGLLIAFAARRAIERGSPLGYLADQLQLRFGDAQPNAVATVIEAADDPITLDQLIAGLDRLAPSLAEAPPEEGMLNWLSREMSQLFVFRHEDTPSPAAERRLERARLFLQSGRAGAALAEVRNLPNAAAANAWIVDAERYAAAQRSLELLETTAVLESRDLRDGAGQRVEQPGLLN